MSFRELHCETALPVVGCVNVGVVYHGLGVGMN